jgi:hypothetical protein
LKQFEYIMKNSAETGSDLEKDLNQIGKEGWELAAYLGTNRMGISTFIYKREKDELKNEDSF